MKLLKLILFLAASVLQQCVSDSADGALSSSLDPCIGGYYLKLSNKTSRVFIPLSIVDEVYPLTTKSCFDDLKSYEGESVNIVYNISKAALQAFQSDSSFYVAFSVRVYGEAEISVKMNSMNSMMLPTAESSHIIDSFFEFENTIINYTVRRWTPDHGLGIEAYMMEGRDIKDCPEEDTANSCRMGLYRQMCAPKDWFCNGVKECLSGDDEQDCPGCCTRYRQVTFCGNSSYCECITTLQSYLHSINGCNAVVNNTELNNNRNGVLRSSWPRYIPSNTTYRWNQLLLDQSITFNFNKLDLHPDDRVYILDRDEHVASFSKEMEGKNWTVQFLRGSEPRLVIILTSLDSEFDIDYTFNAVKIIQLRESGAAECDHQKYTRSCMYKSLCFMPEQHCDQILDCPNGYDELGCAATQKTNYACDKDEIACPNSNIKGQCFDIRHRCDGNSQCPDKYDELNCDSTLCGPHNGTFLCSDGECIFETWVCDKQRDCSDGADELYCDGTSRQVITASVMGSLVCAIMIVIAAGCSCKLHAHRLYENMHNNSRYESPMTVIQNQLMRRAAPPPYAEAMQRSRPFDEVQSEYMAALEQQRANRRQLSEEDGSELRSIASSSGIEVNDSVVEVNEDGSEERRNAYKPPEESQHEEQLIPGIDPPPILEPKSDDEGGLDDPPSPISTRDSESNSTNSSSRRQMVRSASVDSDVSMLSESDDVPLIS